MAGESLVGPSRTAVLSAVGRALHAEGPDPRALSDGYASALAGDDGVALLAELRSRLSVRQLASFSRWTAARARFVEDLVESAIVDGVDQYVILGAGLDSFAYRRDDVLETLRVFEVDHPLTQGWKRQRLHSLGIQEPSGLSFVPVDFEQESFGEALSRSGFDRNRPSVFSWIGVTMYLSVGAVEATLKSLAGNAPGSRIAISYDLPASALSGLQLQVRDALALIVSQLGEPFVTTFERDTAEDLLRRCGFDNLIHFSPADAAKKYFGDRGNTLPVGGSQRLLCATVPTAN